MEFGIRKLSKIRTVLERFEHLPGFSRRSVGMYSKDACLWPA